MASFIVDSCRDQRFSLETWNGSKNDSLVSMHTSDHRRSVSFLRGARSFTEGEEEEYVTHSGKRYISTQKFEIELLV